MAEVEPRFWGLIVHLDQGEGCFAAQGVPAGELALGAIPVWGPLILAAVKIHKAWIGANTGDQGVDLHFNWGGFLHFVGRRGNPFTCS
ncbi:hypothetical protein [Actinomycetospora termitidis]|uniref:Uncharacterized protein n=1 Tax=Actinomycetospora termitidis TaxID=3053470 RepID=A0ABT7MGT5_9PSEU|nr:hypothetical protein [Actinomycetospora sp. Odt1-22]MDL5159891.1 hypothetical protein [Actinomycetospora sp. Odt1-22]